MQRGMRHVNAGHIAKTPPLGLAAQQTDGTAVSHHQHPLRDGFLGNIVQRRRQAIPKCGERFSTWRWVCHWISPELSQGIPLLLCKPFDAHPLPTTEVILRESTVHTQWHALLRG